MDWRMIGVCFNMLQFIFMAIIFAVLKFNDMKHLDSDLKELKNDFHKYELTNDSRHIENIKAMNEISNTVSNLVGKFEVLDRK